jgi:microcystin-dependent protein
MAQPYIGEIRMFAGNFAPAGWMFCWGQSLPISENDTLFTLIGTTYGGDGEQTFNLPDLQSRVPVHMGQGPGMGHNYQISEQGGVESVTLTTQQIPVHTHPMMGSGDTANSPNTTQNVVARSPQVNAFLNAGPSVAMASQFLLPAGGSQPHTNIQPFLCVNFIISLFGIYPSAT